MKVKRVKRAGKILNFFKFSYKISPPFKVLVDGTFCLAALQNKINLREQLPKYIGAETEIITTKCILAELETLGSVVYGALHICKQFEVETCPHTPCRSAAECVAHLARRMNTGHSKYIMATQDSALTEKLRAIPGVPLLFIRFNTILLDKISEQSKNSVDKVAQEIAKVREMKKSVLGDGAIQKKKKKTKGVNPMSCKKKKITPDAAQAIRTGERTASGKRKRTKRKNTAEQTNEE